VCIMVLITRFYSIIKQCSDNTNYYATSDEWLIDHFIAFFYLYICLFTYFNCIFVWVTVETIVQILI
jgi:hypothetical protein